MATDPDVSLSRIQHRMQLRTLHRETYIMILVFALIVVTGFNIASSRHSDGAAARAEDNTQRTQQQVKTLEAENTALKQQVADLLTAIKLNRTETLKNRDAGSITRSIVCQTLKAVDVVTWGQTKDCQPATP